MADPDFGTDAHCIDSIDGRISTVSGTLGLAEACARRLGTPRGRLWYDPDYGYDLRQHVNAIVSPSRISSDIQDELLKDERVDSVTADVSIAAGQLTVTIGIGTALGPFSLVLAVSALTVQLVTFT